MGEKKKEVLRVVADDRVKLEFHDVKLTSDGAWRFTERLMKCWDYHLIDAAFLSR